MKDLEHRTADLGLKMDGILIINKPSGITSHDVVLKLRKILNQKKIGHTGTLDPLATGVLVLCIGKATKIVQFLQCEDKEYEGEIIFGIKTNTGDITGEIIEERDCNNIEEVNIKEIFNGFKGESLQTPPAFSAISVNGERLYKLARRGVKVDLKPRKINIYNLEILDISKGKNTIVSFRVKCSKGTYIRSLCEDIGESLGCIASLKSLRRISSGIFHIKESFTLEDIEVFVDKNIIKEKILSINDGLTGLALFKVGLSEIPLILSGNRIKLKPDKPMDENEIVRLVDENKRIIALGRVEKVFSEDEDSKNNYCVVKPFRVLV